MITARKLSRAAVRQGAEILFALGLVATCFVSVLALLSVAFPEGANLSDLVRPGSRPTSTTDVGLPNVEFAGSEERVARFAKLAGKTRKVKGKAADAIAWTDTQVGEDLGRGHAIQTFESSSASVAFGDENGLVLGPNSLVVLENFDSDPDGGDRQVSLVILGGTISGSIAARAEEAVRVEVGMADTKARIEAADTDGETSRFQVTVDEDRTSSISVLDGSARIMSAGQSMVVEANQALQIDATGKVSAPRPLPGSPRLLSPAVRSKHAYRSLPPRIRFEWNRVPDADRYRFSVARDAEMTQLVYENEQTELEFVHGGLEAGTYYWRVAALSGPLAGLPSRTGRLQVIHDEEPPALSMSWPDGAATEASIVLSGTTEPGSHVFIANQEVPVDERGAFSHPLTLERGTNVVVVEAVDALGNTTYESRMIRTEF